MVRVPTMSKKAKRLVSDFVGQMSDGETVTVYQLADYVNRRLRVGSVSTGSVAVYCQQIGMKRVGVGVGKKCRWLVTNPSPRTQSSSSANNAV